MIAENPGLEYRSLSVRITDAKTRDSLFKVLMSYLHLRNMLLLLIKRNREEHRSQPEQRPDLFRLLTNSRIMRALLWQQKGGNLAEKVQFLQHYYAHDQMMQDAISLGFGLKDKIISELIKQMHESWKSLFAKLKAGDGSAREPKPRALKDCRSYSLPIDMECVSFRKKNCIRLLLSRGVSYSIYCHHQALLNTVGSWESIKRMEICLRNGDIYLLFSYIQTSLPIKPQQPEKYAGMDLGVSRLLSIYVLDEKSPSFAIDGQLFSSRNAEFNRKMASLKSLIDPIRNQIRALEKSARIDSYLPFRDLMKMQGYRLLHSKREQIQRKIDKLLRKRSHFLDSNFKKLANRLLMTLRSLKVTHLITSRNIIEKKTVGAAMGAIQNQRFYFLPLGKLVDVLKLFGPKFGITVIDRVDEAYTSKTSCLSGDVVKAHELFKDKATQDAALRSDVFQGRRVTRGLYKDRQSGIVVHADINAAVNILKLHLKDPNLFNGIGNHIVKLANPRVIHSQALLCLLDRPCGFPCVVGEQAHMSHDAPEFPLNPGFYQV